MARIEGKKGTEGRASRVLWLVDERRKVERDKVTKGRREGKRLLEPSSKRGWKIW